MMAEDAEAEAEIVIEGGMLGVKSARFSPLVNFSYEILHFIDNSEYGKSPCILYICIGLCLLNLIGVLNV